MEMETEFVDPITLTLMEEAVIATCGHSFSHKSLVQWFRSQRKGGQALTCPVCKATIDGRPVPNFALRNAISRYRKLQGIPSREPSLEEEEEEASLYDEKDTLLFNEPTNRSSTSREAATSARLEEEEVLRRARGRMPERMVELPPLAEDHVDQSCCCCCECQGCGLCSCASRYEDAVDCRSGVMRFLPTWFFSSCLCSISFGRRSNWCMRTVCGLMFPLFLILFLVFATVDTAFMLVLGSLWVVASLTSMLLCFWWLQPLCFATRACCLPVHRSPVVQWPMCVYNSFCGFFLLPEIEM